MALMPPLVTVMVKAAEAAAKTLARDFGEVEQLQVSKKGPSNFVTAADKKAEKTLHYHLSKARPDFGFLMEEGGAIEGNDKSRKFIIDPLDGTNNFLHGVPHWCITMAVEEEGEITHGIVFDVVRNEMFWASKGQGAFISNRKIRVSGRAVLEDGLVGTGTPAKGRGNHELFARDMQRVLPQVSGMRRMGSAALDLAYVACGRFDSYWEREIQPWDVAAGILIVREAGGLVSEVNGGKNVLYGGSILAANPAVYQDMLGLLN
ncbi:MAG: inositol monophosphatase [Alphaproteobacteria bacterium]|nr:inositol monophosphatase [Alphaproteobacteria bacterium]